jgi:3-oxoacyl-[acyl-carrier protein] reductase
MQIKGRTIVITGAGRGLGRAMALAFAERGGDVAALDLNADDVAETARQCTAHGVTARGYSCNVTNEEQVVASMDAIVGDFGRLDVLVNNAGVTRDTLALRMKREDWDLVIDTDLSSAFHLAKAALRGMLRSGWGRIVNVSSVVALMGNVGQANYVAAKAGLIGLTKALAREYAGKGVTVNAVAPGFIESDMTAALGDELRAAYLRQIPVGRFGRPAEVAAAIAFLASDEAAYVNGQTLIVDGGMVMS